MTKALNMKQFSEQFGWSEKTTSKLIRTGQLKCIQLQGRTIRILPEHIQEFEQQHQFQPDFTSSIEQQATELLKRKLG